MYMLLGHFAHEQGFLGRISVFVALSERAIWNRRGLNQIN